MSADKEKLDQDQEAVSCSWSGVELGEQRPCDLQVERVEIAEPMIDVQLQSPGPLSAAAFEKGRVMVRAVIARIS
jgi:hypothetical protein